MTLGFLLALAMRATCVYLVSPCECDMSVQCRLCTDATALVVYFTLILGSAALLLLPKMGEMLLVSRPSGKLSGRRPYALVLVKGPVADL